MVPRVLLLLLLACAGWPPLHAQSTVEQGGTKVEILHADEWSFDEQVAPGAQRLLGQVRFRHAGALMSCDSAYLYQDQRVDAFGAVRITQGDTLSITGQRLAYSGAERMARIQGDVRMRNPDMELSTPALDHDLRAKRSVYTEGGRIVDHRDGTVLTSRRGTYLSDARTFIFSQDVRMEHPERIVTTDTMHYGTTSGMASFFGPTHILQPADSSVLLTQRGTYDTRSGQARFTRRSSIRTKGRLLEGDTLHYDRDSGLGLAWGRVQVADSSGEMIARGGHGRYDERSDRSMITDRAELVMIMEGDSLFLHGDTLFTHTETRTDSLTGAATDHRTVTARRHVRFFKSDIQGVCDTLVYAQADSLIRMFHRPALWTGKDQITGTHIRIQLANSAPHRLYVEGDGFLLAQADSVHFDQVTGSLLTGYFADGELHRIVAEGNARTVYFAREEKDGVEEIMGVNRADCSTIQVGIADGEVRTVTFMERPDAMLYPLEKAPPEELRMKGADWRGDERPKDQGDIFRSEDQAIR